MPGPLTSAYMQAVRDLTDKQRFINDFAAGLLRDRRLSPERALDEINQLEQDRQALNASREFHLAALQAANQAGTEVPTADDLDEISRLTAETTALFERFSEIAQHFHRGAW